MIEDEREGFVSGFQDCYIFDAKGVSGTTGWTGPDYVNAISVYYRDHRNQAAVEVSVVLREVNRTGKARARLKGGEQYKEPHGYYDGLWWRQNSGSGQLGYVEGYLACHSSSLDVAKTTYSQSAGQYQKLVDSYIAQHPKSDDEKLAMILRRFVDQANNRVPVRKKGP